jgi:hypothetical protein
MTTRKPTLIASADTALSALLTLRARRPRPSNA